MTYYVYAIKSLIKNYIYIGLTNNLVRRFKQHNQGREQTTKHYKPFKIIYVEQLTDRLLARQREKYLKSGIGREYLKRIN